MRPDWKRLGLRHNPFENVEPGDRNDWADVPAAIAAALGQHPVRLELRGSRGAGKSTLLRAVAARLPDPHPRVVRSGASLSQALAAPFQTLLVDEADQVPNTHLREALHRAEAQGASLLLASHAWRSEALPGTWTRVDLDRVTALGWVERRVREATLEHAHPPALVAAAERLHPRLGRVNYRTQRALYELCEELARGAGEQEAEEKAVRRAAVEPTAH